MCYLLNQKWPRPFPGKPTLEYQILQKLRACVCLLLYKFSYIKKMESFLKFVVIVIISATLASDFNIVVTSEGSLGLVVFVRRGRTNTLGFPRNLLLLDEAEMTRRIMTIADGNHFFLIQRSMPALDFLSAAAVQKLFWFCYLQLIGPQSLRSVFFNVSLGAF